MEEMVKVAGLGRIRHPGPAQQRRFSGRCPLTMENSRDFLRHAWQYIPKQICPDYSQSD
jgi:hypothetical protein